jgi:hypothetical protein
VLFYDASMQIFIVAITFKHFRMSYAFTLKISRLNMLMRNEWALALLVFVSLLVNSTIYGLVVKRFHGPSAYLRVSFYFQELYFLASSVMVLIAGYFIRKIDESYRLKEECLYVVILLSANLGYNLLTALKID